MTGPQYAVLCAVAVHGSADRPTVVETASLDKSTVAEVVDRLTGRGLLLPDGDRRGKKLMLSDTARRRLPDFTRGAAAVNADTMALLPSPDHEPFLDALADVAYRAGST